MTSSATFAERQYDESKPIRNHAAATAEEVTKLGITTQQQSSIEADYDAYNKGTFRPLEQSIVVDYDTPEKRQVAADAAMGDGRWAMSTSPSPPSTQPARANWPLRVSTQAAPPPCRPRKGRASSLFGARDGA
jgi:hypothetical protein